MVESFSEDEGEDKGVGGVEDAPSEIRDLLSRKVELEKRHRMQELHRQRVQVGCIFFLPGSKSVSVGSSKVGSMGPRCVVIGIPGERSASKETVSVVVGKCGRSWSRYYDIGLS